MPGGHWVCFWMRCGSTKLEVVKGGDTLKIEYPQSMIELYWNIKKIMKGKKKYSHGGNISNVCFHFMELFPVLGHNLSLRTRTERGDNTPLRNIPDIDVVPHEWKPCLLSYIDNYKVVEGSGRVDME